MAISFASATGNIMNRIGAAGAVIVNAYANMQTQLTALTNVSTGVVAEYNAESDLQAEVGGQYINLLNGMGQTFGSPMSQLIQDTCNRMVFRDNPRISQNLQSLNLLDSLKEIIRQMNVAGATVQSSTIGATVTQFAAYSSTGNGVLTVSTRRQDGLVNENSYPETITATCTEDSYVGAATAGNEVFTVTGVGSANTVFDFNWPLGSEAQINLNAIDGNEDDAAGNVLTNSGFNAWTGTLPLATLDNWTLAVGTFGTDIIENTSIVFDGAAAVQIIGDGATLTQIYQDFDDSTMTAGTLDPLQQYSVNLWLRRDGTAAGAGVLTIDLTDQLGNAVTDASGNANSFTVALTGLTTSFVAYSGTFRTPQVEPATGYRVRLRLTTALTTGRSVYLDKLSLGAMTQVYLGGPSVAIHAGSTPFVQQVPDDPGPPTRGDICTVVVTNDFGGASNHANFQTLMNQTCGMAALNLLLPSSAVPSVSNGLIS